MSNSVSHDKWLYVLHPSDYNCFEHPRRTGLLQVFQKPLLFSAQGTTYPFMVSSSYPSFLSFPTLHMKMLAEDVLTPSSPTVNGSISAVPVLSHKTTTRSELSFASLIFLSYSLLSSHVNTDASSLHHFQNHCINVFASSTNSNSSATVQGTWLSSLELLDIFLIAFIITALIFLWSSCFPDHMSFSIAPSAWTFTQPRFFRSSCPSFFFDL